MGWKLKMAQISKADYRAAKKSKNPKVRQEFLDAINLEDTEEFISRIKYMGNQEIEEDDLNTCMDCRFNLRLMENFPKILSQIKPLRKAIIRVFPAAFKYYSYEFFLSVLIDHEGHHARQDFQKPVHSARLTMQKISPNTKTELRDYLETLPEIPAEWNQLEKATKRNLSQKERDSVTVRINNYKGLVSSYAPVFGRDWKADLSKILCNSPYDGTVREIYGIN
jgi:hypothetical protein